ncbi:MAG TPA: TrkH family potassium uptake protein [Bacteroidetes bacterium]|nr:TrkH family potassium uptake protein [Bacteroidota bacterium]
MINKRIIVFILGFLLMLESGFILISFLVSLLYREGDSMPLFVSSMITFVAGALMWFFNRKVDRDFGKREGYIIVSTVWIVFSFFGTLPYLLSGAIPNLTDAFFETMSGFTTTGSSILNNIDSLPHGILFWRSITQWMGGMGIIVLSLAVLPYLGVGSIQLFAAEVPGPTPDKLHPRVKETAKRLWGIYILFTLAESILLIIGRMNPFDAVCHSFTTMATGGYSTKQASIAFWGSPFIQYVIIFFMFLAGMNFTLSYYALHRQFRKVIKNEEFRWYVGFVTGFSAIVIIFLILIHHKGVETAFREGLFQVVSILTTTGYVTTDYLKWEPFLVVILLVLMFFGGSAGSTGGSMKIMRIALLIKNSRYELRRLIHPNAVIPVRFNHHNISSRVLTNVLAFAVIYILVFAFGVVVISTIEPNIDSAISAVATTLGNVGPGMGSVGPMDNFYHINAFGKWFLSFLMMLGRLELFTVLVLFSPAFWKK